MKFETKIRVGKIRPNHNVAVHGTVVSSFVTGRIAVQAAETSEPCFSRLRRGGVVAILRTLPNRGYDLRSRARDRGASISHLSEKSVRRI
jgi:hypothetical protein